MKNPNFLVLDEPTNDLDIMTLNVLEEYLRSFAGCLLIVSHDRFFIDKIVDHVFAFEGNGLIRDFPGNYTQYADRREEEEKARREASKTTTTPSQPTREKNRQRRLTYKEQQEMKQLEIDMESLNSERTELETALSSGTLSPEKLLEASRRVAEIIDILDEKEMRWLELSEI